MATIDEQFKEINKSFDTINAGSGLDAIPNAPLGTAALTEQRDFNLTQPAISIEDVGLEGELEVGAGQFVTDIDKFTQNLQTQREEAQTRKTESLEDLITKLSTARGQETQTFLAEEEFGVPQLQRDLSDINNEILQEQRALKKQIDRINENVQGGLVSGIVGEIANARRISLSTQADLSIIQLMAQGRFDSAIARADRKARMLFEQETNEIAALERNFAENKALFTLAEQRQFDSTLADRTRKLNKEKAAEKTLQDTKLDALKLAQINGAPIDVLRAIQTATTPEEVITAGGRFGAVDLLQRRQLRASIAASAAATALSQEKLEQLKTGIKNRGVSPITGKPFTEGQLNAGTFASRMSQAEGELSGGRGLFIPFIIPGLPFPGFLKSEERRLFEQAERNFITAQLRRESGAAIAPDEFVTARQIYIPLTSDSQEVLEAKARSREIAITGMINSSAGAFQLLEESLREEGGVFSPDELIEFDLLLDEGIDDETDLQAFNPGVFF